MLPDFDPSTFLEIVIGLHRAVQVSVVNCAITNVVAADRNINDKVVRAIQTKVHKLDIALFVAGGRHRRHLVVDAHRVACVAGQLRQHIHDMIVASGGFRVLFASKHVIALRIRQKFLHEHIVRATECALSIGIGVPMGVQKKPIQRSRLKRVTSL